jgi:acetamidase/formamidase
MNRGPDSKDVDKDLVETFNKYRDDSMPDDRGNPASGCIWINGSKKGEILNVEIGEIRTHNIGYTKYRGSTGAFPSYLEPSAIGEVFKVVKIIDDKVIWNDKLSIPIKPMIGVVGLAPEFESRSNAWAGEWGGNFDIQEITTGAIVQIPINHDGALLHIGDMHAIQGDGEICGGGGIETGGTVMLKCKSEKISNFMKWPRIINDEYIMTTAQGKPAEDAFRIALSEMLLWLENDYGIDKKEGFMLLAQILEARVTQFVNPTYTYLLKVKKKYLE